MECPQVKFKANCNKNWGKWLNMQAIPLVFSKPLKILPARGNCKCIHEKSYSKEYKTKLECRKVICRANHSKIWAHLVWSLCGVDHSRAWN